MRFFKFLTQPNLRPILLQNHMKLRKCLSVLLLGVFPLVITSRAADSNRQYYEMRVYSTQNEKQQTLINDYWQKAAIPAYNRAGVQQIGVFTETQDSPTNKVYVLIPFDSLSTFESLSGRLSKDSSYQTAAADFMNRTKNDPPYTRLDTSLLLAMSAMPTLVLPPSTTEKKPWIFELRTYISPTEAKGANKIEMFNAGEIAIMKEVGLNPVFFAGTIVGPQMPSLVYMVSGEDMDKHKEHWKGFGPHPGWKKLSADPQYKDNMTGIQNVFLKRTSASQI
jgi:hypothetical protein